MDTDQRIRIIEEKLETLGMTIKGWAKINELDHRIVEDLVRGNLRGTHGVALNARRIMEQFFGPVFGP
jgi:plasmid maintenance system antidote protein VapI